MNNKIKLAVAGAVLSAASVANAGIVIPAGDWTIDINGNVNAFANFTSTDKVKGASTIAGGLAGNDDLDGEDRALGINTGLLPAWLGFTGTTRQNDVDVSFTISFQPNVSDNGSAGDAKTPLNRQAFVTFGDKSWGTFKLGKDLGVFAGNAILNDMTLLGVGSPSGGSPTSGAATSLGGIGTGYIYPAWKGQVSYTTPNFNGFTATVGITNPNNNNSTTLYQDRFGLEAQVQYAFDSGKVWASGASYKAKTANAVEFDREAMDIGAAINFGNIGLVAYYYNGDGAGTTVFGGSGATAAGVTRDSDGGYVQATYVIPAGTKLGVSYGISKLDLASGETVASNGSLLDENKRWTVGAYHPLTKHLNLVAEYNSNEAEAHDGTINESQGFWYDNMESWNTVEMF
jgi:predicted porin